MINIRQKRKSYTNESVPASPRLRSPHRAALARCVLMLPLQEKGISSTECKHLKEIWVPIDSVTSDLDDAPRSICSMIKED